MISQILHRDFCGRQKSAFIKDLSKIGRDLKDVIFIDVTLPTEIRCLYTIALKNLESSFALQPDNGLKIKDFIHDNKDSELQKFVPFLEHLADVSS